jgi:UDP-2,3-diacylglucosamine pyrophosphatase LpxH
MNSTQPFSSRSRLRYRTVWLSDIHLGNRDCQARHLLDFLQRIDCDRLYLAGDIVDMLALKQRVYWPSEHTQVLQHLYELANTGTEVIYVPGNHDMPMRHYHRGLLLNVQLYRQHVHETLQGKRLLVVHGDEFDHAVLYRAMNRFIGEYAYNLMAFLNRAVRGFRQLLRLPYWSLANYLKENIKQARATIEAFEHAAAAEAKQRGLDGIVCGHIHKPELRSIDGVLYCNDGDWTESCSALVETISGELELLDWSAIHAIISDSERPELQAA